MFIDFHAIQAIGPANINRDDSGSPKSTVFGGTRRTRVSSQAWKRAIRKDFEEHLDAEMLGERTLFAVDRIAKAITEEAPEFAEQSQKMAEEVLKAGGIKIQAAKKKKDDPENLPEKLITGYLLFLARAQIKALAHLAVTAYQEADGKIDKKSAKAAINDKHSIDVALFGRMIADSHDLSSDACCQVAHAVSVHPMEIEFDYFTAVDDNAPEDNAGAGMIGSIEFNASTLYRYATINVDALVTTLGSVDAAKKAIGAFTKAFALSMPTGKQTTFANRTRPEFFAISIRTDQPVNFVDAFEDAILVSKGRTSEATRRLAEYAIQSDKIYGSDSTNYYLATGTAATEELQLTLANFGENCTLPEIVSHAEEVARKATTEIE
ncbi:CRISPR-associated protein Cas7/Cse4/CasC, subtype I-E/ECOLI [Corynebacterium mustelae]|uniref:CRISPR-associated protein Cas7/Cse4/CasC, subtype I-E/ECOLI n=1 Tax=Corynebacterium mustelae TaxID=571915 RepID=A0A0G3H4P0_9CORY|nr:type I-E CRISPR-associated protein Cas7/Cse4/CasC [Corynebacterium mustelae]AKK06788.1 CRISPR-associated protein Cas7/Cse4/CasC, subtype I-E/ECOLI [Corynebacterium mustelae]